MYLRLDAVPLSNVHWATMTSTARPARPARPRRLTLALVLAAAALALTSAALPIYAHDDDRTLYVSGEVSSPASYTRSQLAALPQATATLNEDGHQVTVTGVLLETLVTMAGPAYPSTLLNTKNEILRVTATVRGDAPGPVTFALGELDANFGNHPALLVLTRNGKPVEDGLDHHRAGVLETLQKDFVTYERAQGFPPRALIWKFVLRNSVVAAITQRLARGRAFGIEPVGVNLANPGWKVAFLHQTSAHAIVLQGRTCGRYHSGVPANPR